MKAAVVEFKKGDTWVQLHVDPSEVGMVLAAAGGHNFPNRTAGYVECDADDNDGRCGCFHEDEDHGDDDS